VIDSQLTASILSTLVNSVSRNRRLKEVERDQPASNLGSWRIAHSALKARQVTMPARVSPGAERRLAQNKKLVAKTSLLTKLGEDGRPCIRFESPEVSRAFDVREREADVEVDDEDSGRDELGRYEHDHANVDQEREGVGHADTDLVGQRGVDDLQGEESASGAEKEKVRLTWKSVLKRLRMRPVYESDQFRVDDSPRAAELTCRSDIKVAERSVCHLGKSLSKEDPGGLERPMVTREDAEDGDEEIDETWRRGKGSAEVSVKDSRCESSQIRP
jgi:hypothetical protein